MVDIDNAFFFDGTSAPAGWQATFEKYLLQGNLSESVKTAQAEIEKARKANDKSAEAIATHCLARASFVARKPESAFESAEKAKSLFNGVGDKAQLASVGLTLARVNCFRDADVAFEDATDALAMYQAAGMQLGEAAALNMLATVELVRGHGEECLRRIEDAYKLFDTLGNALGKASVLHSKSLLMSAADQKAQSVRVAQEAAELLKDNDDRYAAALLAVTDSAVQASDFDEAIIASKEALSIFEKVGNRSMQVDVSINLCGYYLKMDNFDTGIENAKRTASLCKDVGDAKNQAQAVFLRAQMQRAKLGAGSAAWPPPRGINDDDLADLQNTAEEAVSLFSDLADDEGEAGARFELAHALVAMGQLAKGNEEISRSMQLFAALGDNLGECKSAIVCAQVKKQMGSKDSAQKLIDKALQLAQDSASIYLEKVCKQFISVMEAERPKEKAPEKKVSAGKKEGVEGEGVGGGGVISPEMYMMCIHRAMNIGETHGEHLFDSPATISGLETALGIRFPWLRNRPPPGKEFDADACAEAFRKKPNPPKITLKGGGSKPAAEQKIKSSLGGVSKKPKLPPMAIPTAKDEPAKAVGSDLLGGRMEGVPEEVHEDMVALASSGDIPVTRIVDRASNVTKRPTFYGEPIYRDALRFGYIHPTSAAPRGMKWKSVRAGAFKLVSVQ